AGGGCFVKRSVPDGGNRTLWRTMSSRSPPDIFSMFKRKMTDCNPRPGLSLAPSPEYGRKHSFLTFQPPPLTRVAWDNGVNIVSEATSGESPDRKSTVQLPT